MPASTRASTLRPTGLAMGVETTVSSCLSHLWCAKILSSRLWTMSRPPATIRKKEDCFQL
jgi:hypothetical protein